MKWNFSLFSDTNNSQKPKNIGALGEKIALNYLKKKGYKILELNWFNHSGKRLGEIDIIALSNEGILVFFEVKTRKVCDVNDKEIVMPENQVNYNKFNKIKKTSELYIRQNNMWQFPIRIDIISIILISHELEVIDIKHMQNVFY